MALGPFGKSTALSMGVELELQLINSVDFDLTSAANDLLELLSRKPFPGTVTPEMTQSMIEIATGIHTAHTPLLAELRGMGDSLVAACERLNIGLCGGGTHPFQRWSEQRVFSKPRFQEISLLYGYLAKRFTVFGQHVHIGCASGDDALFLLHSLNSYVPRFIALSASFPYSQRVDMLFVREDILEKLRFVEPHFSALNSANAAEEIEACAARDGNHASWLRGVFTQTRNLQSMAQASTRALRSAATN